MKNVSFSLWEKKPHELLGQLSCLTGEVKLEEYTRNRGNMKAMVIWIRVGGRLGQQYQEMLLKTGELVSFRRE